MGAPRGWTGALNQAFRARESETEYSSDNVRRVVPDDISTEIGGVGGFTHA